MIRQQEEEKKLQQEEEEKRQKQRQQLQQQEAPVSFNMSRSMRSDICPPPSMSMSCPAPPPSASMLQPSGGMPPMMESLSRARSSIMEESLADDFAADEDEECEDLDGFAEECKESVMMLDSECDLRMEEEEVQVEKKKSKRKKSKEVEEEGGEEPAPRVANTSAAIKVQKWTSDSPYMATIKQSKTPYETYLELRQVNQASPAFFLDVADYWLSDLKNQEQGLNILTNVLELELESEQLLRIAAYRLDQEKRWDLAEMLFEKVLEMRPDQPQSHRDLALVKEKLGKLEEAADLLNQVIYKEWDSRYDEVELTAAIELNHVLSKNPKLPICDEGLRHYMDLDLRISMA